ncbi:branched-chain amino acid ABC transporter substrate-binding protein [Streptosporangium violaceochromogenes]|nr:branched-chain amino acid ABC transporter substrate-binding protein [Streptosporangium violaceochromogenes]
MSTRTIRLRLTIAVLSLSLLAACGRGSEAEAGQGFTDDTIVLGANAPLSGPASGFAAVNYGARAYFTHLNDTEGGVTMADGKKRKIKYIVDDDGYDPARALGVVKRLVEQEKVAALVEPFGTDPNLATREYLNNHKVPQIFIQSTNPKFNLERDKYPYSMTGSASSVLEAAVLAKYAIAERPNAKIAILRANDEGGQAYARAFEKALKGSQAKVVKEQSYATTDASIDSQVSILAASGADVFANFGTPKFAALAISRAPELGWKPLMLLPSQASGVKAVLEPAGLDNAKGAVTVGWFKDPTDPQWAGDESMRTFREAMKKSEPRANANDSFAVAGWAVADVFVKMLKTTEPSREGLRKAVGTLNGQTSDLLLPGIEFHTSDSDGFGIESLWVQRFNGEHYTSVGKEPISLQGQAAGLVGE